MAKLLFWELWKCLTIPIKIIVSLCRKCTCLPESKKSTLPFTYFLRYCMEIANFLFWVILTWKKFLFIFWLYFILFYFLLSVVRVRTMVRVSTSKMIVSLSRNLWPSVGKNQFFTLSFPWDIAKILENCCFEYFGNA